MTTILSIADSLAKIRTWAEAHTQGITFRPPAAPEALENFREKSSLSLPDDLQALLFFTDGETRNSAGIIGNWRLMPIAEIQAAWGLLTQIDQKGAFSGLEPKPSPYIHRSWWHSSWIPFVSSDTGDYFCLDTAPPDPNRFGQVILFLQAQPERYLVAAGLGAWLDRIWHDLDAGRYRFDRKEGFNGEAFMWSALEGKHHFDDFQGTLIVEKTDEP